jgi:pimeloyl-ACP methyl ester carboxylesterase
MPDEIIIANFVALSLLAGFWILQVRTRVFSTRYYVQIIALLCVAGAGAYVFGRLVTGTVTGFTLVVALAWLSVAIYHGGLAVIKLAESDTRYRWMHKANRALVSYDTPHERFKIRTDDGESIQGLKLCASQGHSNKAIIVCHGAGRSKNTLPVVLTCQILATKYDVFTFDFRGHMESSGVFKADGDTEYDLKAVVEYVKKAGYEKVAVVGWSIGAWTALLSAARGRAIDVIVAGSPPPFNMSKLFYFEALKRIRAIELPLLAGVAVVRNMWVTMGKHLLSIEDFVRDLPQIPILLVYNDYDYTLRIPAEAFEQLFEKLPLSSEKIRLPGRGHLFDWPNTYFLWNQMISWLDQHM